MDTEPLIIAALSGITPKPEALHSTAENGADYIVFNDSDNRPAYYEDDTDGMWVATVQIHYFTRGNPRAKTKEIRNALRKADFSILSTVRLYEKDTGYTHTVIEASIEGAKELEE